MVPRVSVILATGMLGRALHWSDGNVLGQLTPQLGRPLRLPDVIILSHGGMLLRQPRRLVGKIALARVFVAGPHCSSGSPLIQINLLYMLPRDLGMILSSGSARLSWDLDPVRGGLRNLLRLFDLHGILGTQGRGSRLLLGLWSPAGLVLAFVLEVRQQLALGEHRVIRTYSLVFEADVWVVNWPSGMVLVNDDGDLPWLMENLGEADDWWVILIPVPFVLLGSLWRRLFGGDCRLASLSHVLLNVLVQIIEIFLNFMVFIDFDC